MTSFPHRIQALVAALLISLVLSVTVASAASGRGRGGDDTTTGETTTEETTTTTTTGPVGSPPVLVPTVPPKVARRSCGSRSRVVLTVHPAKEWLAVDFQVVARRSRPGLRPERWRVVILHERRVQLREWAVSKPVTGWLQKRKRVANWDGPDAITARAVSALGETCAATLTI